MTQTQAIFKAISELNKVCANKTFEVGDRQNIDLNFKPGTEALVMVGREPLDGWGDFQNLPLRFTFEFTEAPDEWRIVDPFESLDIEAIERKYQNDKIC
ncbi:hypothetical protein BDD43_3408 [Mucilaginibacter gracilis]|uniref:Uncharacterized protein n=1 Tax=Mucilaginibacter gracilis TaxID=423350 RepID=A0A495J2J4_9SPHI|nr:hypothetical protein [Mucilaginibacter gracilis]RKR83206.1 hypothetical protein BDD43_3408 [Mucilaginibacter gracilis]